MVFDILQSMENIKIVVLNPCDWKDYKDIRLRALKEEPQAYLSTYEDNLKNSDDYWRERLEDVLKGKRWLIFAKKNGKIVGMAGGYIENHDAHVAAVYVIPQERGQGISKLLMSDLLLKIKENKSIRRIIVEVNIEQIPAYNLYKNSGFKEVKRYKLILGDGKEHELAVLEKFA